MSMHTARGKDVITSLELERIMNAAGPTGGHLERLSDGKAPKEIVFIQCVGRPLRGRQRQELLFKSLLYVHSKTCNAHPRQISGYKCDGILH